MRVCPIAGCAWQFEPYDTECLEHRRPLVKAYEGGYLYYACSYGYSGCEPIGTYVSLRPFDAECAAEKAAKEEMEWLDEEDGAEVLAYGETTHRAKDLFTAVKLRGHRKALLDGQTVFLSRF